MKFEVLQEEIAKSLALASRFASARAQLPVLGNILFSATKNKLILSSTNLETSISISIGAKVEKEGELTLPAKTITDLITNLAGGVIKFNLDKESVQIKTSSSQSVVAGMNAADFPDIPRSVKRESLELPREATIIGLKQTLFCVSVDETRPVLTGVLFIFEPGSLTLVSTDGFRLSQKRISLPGMKKKFRVIVPKNILSEISRITEEDSLEFFFDEKENTVTFSAGNIIFSSRILQGEFPSFEKIIPKEAIYQMEVDKEEMLKAVKVAAVFARDSANIVKLVAEAKTLGFEAQSKMSGEQKSKIDARVSGLKSKSFEISFNYRFLEDLLTAIEGETVGLSFSSANAPGVFRDPGDKNYLHLIMPVKIEE